MTTTAKPDRTWALAREGDGVQLQIFWEPIASWVFVRLSREDIVQLMRGLNDALRG